MNRKRRIWAFWTLLLALVLLTTLLVSCAFDPFYTICESFDGLDLNEVTDQDHRVVFEEPGTIMAVHGFACAVEESGSGMVKVEQSLGIPGYANKATVFLNGWKANFLSGDDHHVQSIATAIGKINVVEGEVTWNAAGVLEDEEDNGSEDAINWCYYYTVIAWNDAALNAVVDHDDADNFCQAGTGASDNFYLTKNEGMTTALSSFSSFIQNPNFPPGGDIAVLPRGLVVGWNVDHHLLQVAYNLNQSETFIEHGRKYRKARDEIDAPLPTPVSRVDSGFVSWETHSILKDNALTRVYQFGEMVSALGGNDVGIIQPPFSILPVEDAGLLSDCPSTFGTGIEYDTVDIENVPFEFAIPMLTGWDLSYYCDDEHVKEIGVWIEDWDYVKTPAAPTGTLTYVLASVLKDKDDHPGHFDRHKVTILGLR